MTKNKEGNGIDMPRPQGRSVLGVFKKEQGRKCTESGESKRKVVRGEAREAARSTQNFIDHDDFGFSYR